VVGKLHFRGSIFFYFFCFGFLEGGQKRGEGENKQILNREKEKKIKRKKKEKEKVTKTQVHHVKATQSTFHF